MKKAKIAMVLLVSIALMSGLACNGDSGSVPTPTPTPTTTPIPTSTPISEAPEIPPASTFAMDFEDFESSSAASYHPGGESQSVNPAIVTTAYHKDTSPEGLTMAQGTPTKRNWGFAAFDVGVWSAIIIVGLAVPVAAYVESFNHQPVQQSDGSWIWTYDVTVFGSDYTAELHGAFVDEEIHWDMYITKDGSYEDFNWYSGECNLIITEGTWTLRKSPSDPQPWVGIEWHRSLTDDSADIQYTNIVPDGPENGGYILYGTTADDTYDAFYDIYNKGAEDLVEIEWNRDTKDGRVKNPKYFRDAEWHCWGSDLQDIECQ